MENHLLVENYYSTDPDKLRPFIGPGVVDAHDNVFDRILKSYFLDKRIKQAKQEIKNRNIEFLNNQRYKDSETAERDLPWRLRPKNSRDRSSNFKEVTKGQGERSNLTQLEKMLILYKEQREGIFYTPRLIEDMTINEEHPVTLGARTYYIRKFYEKWTDQGVTGKKFLKHHTDIDKELEYLIERNSRQIMIHYLYGVDEIQILEMIKGKEWMTINQYLMV